MRTENIFDDDDEIGRKKTKNIYSPAKEPEKNICNYPEATLHTTHITRTEAILRQSKKKYLNFDLI